MLSFDFTAEQIFDLMAIGWIVIGFTVLPITLWVTAPFGRHVASGFGPQVANRLGWLVMESPAIWLMAAVFLTRVQPGQSAAWLLWVLWMLHYIHRGAVYPFRIRTRGKRMPVLIVLSAFCFQMINGFLNGLSLTGLGQNYHAGWFLQPVFAVGLGLFIVGAAINITADNALLRLRDSGGTRYQIPRGGLFERISCPNFLGEIIQWLGWAVMCWNLAALSFAVWTIANLVPRALAHHRWYGENFTGYPSDRQAVFPGWL